MRARLTRWGAGRAIVAAACPRARKAASVGRWPGAPTSVGRSSRAGGAGSGGGRGSRPASGGPPWLRVLWSRGRAAGVKVPFGIFTRGFKRLSRKQVVTSNRWTEPGRPRAPNIHRRAVPQAPGGAGSAPAAGRGAELALCAPSAGHLGWRRRRCSVRSTNRQRRDSQGPVEKTTWELARGLIVPQQVEACCTPWCAVLVGGGRARRVVGQQRALDAAAAVVRRSAKKSLRETPGSPRRSRG